MSTTADPAASATGTTTPLHRPVLITGLSFAILGGVGCLILLTLAITGVGHPEQAEIRSLIRALAIVSIAVGSFTVGQVCVVRRRAEDTARRSVKRQTEREDCEGWHAEQYRALYAEIRSLRQLIAMASLGTPRPTAQPRPSRPRRKRKPPSSIPPAAAPGAEPEAKWMEDVAEAYRLGQQAQDDPPAGP